MFVTLDGTGRVIATAESDTVILPIDGKKVEVAVSFDDILNPPDDPNASVDTTKPTATFYDRTAKRFYRRNRPATADEVAATQRKQQSGQLSTLATAIMATEFDALTPTQRTQFARLVVTAAVRALQRD